LGAGGFNQLFSRFASSTRLWERVLDSWYRTLVVSRVSASPRRGVRDLFTYTAGLLLMAMGMLFLPPIVISLPFKILLFVLVDGWYLVVGELVRSIGPVT
jgi:hypothetical protein